MKIDTVVVGLLEENCYILSMQDQVLIIDPGDDADKIISAIQNKKVLGILITHDHFDHVGALDELQKRYQVEVYDKHHLEEKEYQIGPFQFNVIFTPGHSEDSITYYFTKENCMFVGDFVFYRSIGRTDLETGNMNEMQESLSRLKTYQDDIVLYPGHGPKTTLNEEKKYNIFLQS